MECRAVVSSLSDYIDSHGQGLPESEVREIEKHLVACSRCQLVKSDLTEIRSAARELPLHTPPRALWTRILNELEDELPSSERVTRIETLGPSWWERLKARNFTITLPQLAGAGVAAALIVTVFLIGGNQSSGTREQIPITAAQTALLENEDRIRAEIERKLAAINERKAKWDPEVRAEFERNLSKIEESLNESRRKLEANPGDKMQQQMVLNLYTEKHQLLDDMERLKW
jgi:hypothetical protein